MGSFFASLGQWITAVSDFVCGYPLFILLVGGGLYFLLYSGFVPLRYYGKAIKALKSDDNSKAEGQISSFEALASAIAATVGMGNIAGVAIALSIGGPGAIFWMWVSSILGMATKFFEGTLSVMYKGKDDAGEVQGGPINDPDGTSSSFTSNSSGALWAIFKYVGSSISSDGPPKNCLTPV